MRLLLAHDGRMTAMTILFSRTLFLKVRRRALAVSLVALFSSGGVQVSAAQDRVVASLLAFQDSVERTDNFGALHKLEKTLIGVAADQSTPDVHLKLGLLALRIGELGDAGHYDDAASEFQWATELAPLSPVGWFGLGMAEYALGQAVSSGRVGVPTGLMTYASAKRSASAFARAAALDRRFADRLYGFAIQSRYLNDPGRAKVALGALRSAAASPDIRGAGLHLALGRTEREFGDLGQALRAFDRSLASSGLTERGLALLEIARTRFLLGRQDGLGPYFDGARFNDSLSVEAYREDVETIASPAELARFDRTRGESRVAFLKRFWESRDAAEFRQAGERVQEHYRRLYLARRTYPVRRSIPAWRLRVASAVQLDDRGRVVVRHGLPDDRASLETIGIEPNESWRYTRPGQDMILHFVARQDPQNFRLVESLFDLVEAPNVTLPSKANAESETSSFRQRRNTDALLRSRSSLTSFYRRSPTPKNDRKAELDLRTRDRHRGRASVQEALTTDSFCRRFQWDLRVQADVAVIRAAQTRSRPGELRVAFAVPGETMEPVPDRQMLRYPLRLRLLLTTLDGAQTVSRDTAITISTPRLLTRDQFARGEVFWSVPAGRYVARMLFEHGTRAGTVFGPRVLEVSRPVADSLSAGDIRIAGRAVLSRRGEGEADSLPPLSLESYSRSEPIELSLPVEAIEPWHDLVSQVVVIQRGEGGGVKLNQTVALPGVGQRSIIQHTLDTRRFEPGLYSVEMTVTSGDGRLVRRWRDLTLTIP